MITNPDAKPVYQIPPQQARPAAVEQVPPVIIEPSSDPKRWLELIQLANPRPWSIEAHKPNDARVMVYDKNHVLVFHFHPVVGHPEFTQNYRNHAELIVSLVNNFKGE